MRKKTESLEEWRDVKRYEGYYRISSLGRIESSPRKGTPGRVLQPATDRTGYLRVTLGHDGGQRQYGVHRLVLEAFTGPCPNGLESAHLNGIPGDNDISNLVWISHAENCQHRVAHGTLARGEIIGTSKLTTPEVLRIKTLLRNGSIKIQEIARRYDVSRQAIGNIKSGRCWNHV